MRFKVVLRRDKEAGGYVARCPALPGCVSEGDTEEAALANIREAIEGTLVVMQERAAKPSADEVLVEVEV